MNEQKLTCVWLLGFIVSCQYVYFISVFISCNCLCHTIELFSHVPACLLALPCLALQCLGSKKLFLPIFFLPSPTFFFLNIDKMCSLFTSTTFLSAAVNASTLPSYLTFFISPLLTDPTIRSMKEDLRIFLLFNYFAFLAFLRLKF